MFLALLKKICHFDQGNPKYGKKFQVHRDRRVQSVPEPFGEISECMCTNLSYVKQSSTERVILGEFPFLFEQNIPNKFILSTH